METITRAAWLSLAAIHIMPALPLIRPAMIARLYGVDGEGPLALLLTHRAAMFAMVVAATLIAIFDPAARLLAVVVVAISMLSFLLLYTRAGLPAGAMRTIALVDAAGLVPLAFVAVMAFRPA
jgi:hypothetical protein